MKTVVKAVVMAGAMTVAAAGAANAKTLIMALDRAGTLFNAAGSGVAKVASEYSPDRVIVRAFGGPDAYMQDLNDGRYDFSTVSSSTAWFNYHGKNSAKKKYSNLRLIRSGAGALKLGFIVYADSGIKKLSDLKGKRVTSDFGGHSVIQPMATATLNVVGLNWNQVTPVPVTGALASPGALGSDRADAAWASFGMPAVQQINAKRQVRYLSYGDDPKTLAFIRKATYPGVRMTKAPPIKKFGVIGPTYLLTYDSYIVTSKNEDPKIVKAILEALWDHTKDLNKAHFSLRGFSHKAAATDLPMIPYHPAAIAFYKEKGLWTDEIAKANDAVK